MADPFTGEIRAFAFNFPPYNWAVCSGTLINTAQNPALFAIIGNTYGGTMNSTFALPNLQGRVVMGTGSGPGLTTRDLGATVGAAAITLTNSQVPTHNHRVNVQIPANPVAAGQTGTPSDTVVPSAESTPLLLFSDSTPTTALDPAIAIWPVGNDAPTPHENRQPFLVLNYCICLFGDWPARP
jgi:microcystin-dependent protein